MIEQALHDDDYLNICKHYRHIYNTASITSDDAKWQSVSQTTSILILFLPPSMPIMKTLQLIVVFIVLAPFNHEQFDLIHRISLEEKLDKLPVYKFVRLFHSLMAFISSDFYLQTITEAFYYFGADAMAEDRRDVWNSPTRFSRIWREACGRCQTLGSPSSTRYWTRNCFLLNVMSLEYPCCGQVLSSHHHQTLDHAFGLASWENRNFPLWFGCFENHLRQSWSTRWYRGFPSSAEAGWNSLRLVSKHQLTLGLDCQNDTFNLQRRNGEQDHTDLYLSLFLNSW